MFALMFESNAGQPMLPFTSVSAAGCSASAENTGSRFGRFHTRWFVVSVA